MSSRPGVRFDTEVQYLARSASGLRWERLPVRKSTSARTCALTSVLQCAAILGQGPRAQWLGDARGAANRALGTRGAVDDDAILRCFRALGTAVVAEALPTQDPVQIGLAALGALRSGHQGMLRFESAQACRWATVIGAESERGAREARALLLLDSSAEEPWACAHNVRIELQGTAGRAVHARPGFALSCRHLTGEACAVRLSCLIVRRRHRQPGINPGLISS